YYSAACISRFPEAKDEYIARHAEEFHGPGKRKRIRRDDADIAREIGARPGVERLGVDDGRVDVGEDLEFARAAHVVAVAGGAVADDAVAVGGVLDLVALERLDHAVLFGHAPDPLVGLDGHRWEVPGKSEREGQSGRGWRGHSRQSTARVTASTAAQIRFGVRNR